MDIRLPARTVDPMLLQGRVHMQQHQAVPMPHILLKDIHSLALQAPRLKDLLLRMSLPMVLPLPTVLQPPALHRKVQRLRKHSLTYKPSQAKRHRRALHIQQSTLRLT